MGGRGVFPQKHGMEGSLTFFHQKHLQPWLHPYLSVDRNASRLAGVGREPDFSAVEGAADAEQLGSQRPQQPEPGEDQRHPGEEAAGFPWQPHRTLLATGRLWHRGAAGRYVDRKTACFPADKSAVCTHVLTERLSWFGVAVRR